jgi:eukaryotic-like serine/threonine-protein kinase
MRFVGPPSMAPESDRSVTTIGRYEILKTLGKGAMGVVYKARDPLLDRVVAVKTIMSPAGSGKRVRAAYIERFQREAKAAAKMQHPSIVTIFDVGVDNGAPFMVLEYLPGESLADRLDRVRLPLGKGIQIGLDLANALSFAHRQRIVHRDVKPANVLHAGENRWKLADFGIARLPDSDLTQIGIFMGTPGYSPPEAIRHGQYTPQADVFAWGAVLYELLSGRIPYEGPDTRTTNSYVLKGTAPLVRDYDPSIPEPLADVIMRALSPSVDQRFKEGAEAEDALRQAWDECLNSSLVPTSCLTGEEVPHERVGPEMHIAKVPKPKPAAPPAPPAPSPGEPPVLVIESRSSNVSEDAPTQLLVRDSISGPDDRADSPSYLAVATGERVDQNERTDRLEQPLNRGNHLDPTSGMVTRPYLKAAQTTLTTRSMDRRVWLIGGAIVALLVVIAVVLMMIAL